jgi:hypothetical protein
MQRSPRWHFITSAAPSNLRDAAMASSPGNPRDIAEVFFNFAFEEYPEISLRREPQPQSIGHDGHGAGTPEPEESEP